MNKKVVERILKNLLENDTYTLDKEETRILLNYIADLQRKEYNNSKAIEYIKHPVFDGINKQPTDVLIDLLNILQGVDNEK